MDKANDKLTIEIGFHELVQLTKILEKSIENLDQEINTLVEVPKEMKDEILESIRQRNLANVYRSALTEKWKGVMKMNSKLNPDDIPENFYLLDYSHFFK